MNAPDTSTRRFNPLTGIRCFLTLPALPTTLRSAMQCFNPLTGIRCFLTFAIPA